MIYKEEKKDLFSVIDSYFLVHCISADFKMGKGIAVEFTKRFNMKGILQSDYPNYSNWYINSNIGGDCILKGRVLNLITKEKYFHKPTIDTIRTALQKMKRICLENNIKRVAMPTIGAGLDRLKWNEVENQIKGIFQDTDIEILVCKL